ncbi:MAG: VCBS repeat-containing protein [Planctomycetes bacterium]|nr:VCBS repeat-containing protein [Planctomycetota bacterium]
MSRSTFLRAVQGQLGLIAVASWLQGQAPVLESTVRLRGQSAAPGEDLRFSLATPYAGRGFQLHALGPSGASFAVVSGRTDPKGRAEAAVRLAGEESLAGLNAVFHATVEARDGGPSLASGPCLLRFRRTEEPPAAAVGFSIEEGALDMDLAALGARLADLDGDAAADLVATGETGSGPASCLYSNGGSGDFTDVTGVRLAAAEGVPGRAVAVGDVNGDGSPDVLLGTSEAGAETVLLLNDGAGSLRRGGALPGKGGEGIRTNDVLLADLDSDGDADAYLSNGASASHGTPPLPQPNQLLLNDGEGSFTASTGIEEGDRGPTVSRKAAAGDPDGDGDLDLLVANAGENQLLVNDGQARFTDETARLPYAADSTYGAAFADLDLDGDEDIVYGNTQFNPAAQGILLNQGGLQGGEEGAFEVGELPPLGAGQSPIRLGVEVADVDSDGDPDLLFLAHELGNSERPDLYLNQGGMQGGAAGTFVLDVAFPVPPGIYQAMPLGDIDSDGDVDAVGLNAGDPARKSLLRNGLFEAPDPPLGFQRADVNGDLTRDLSDAIAILGHLFLGGEAPGCLAAADVNDSGSVDLSDAIALLAYLFLGAVPPPAPFPGFGDDRTPDGIGCGRLDIFR